MRDLHCIDGEDGHSSVDTEALQSREESVCANKESDHISEGGHRDSYPCMLHGLTKPWRRQLVNDKNIYLQCKVTHIHTHRLTPNT